MKNKTISNQTDSKIMENLKQSYIEYVMKNGNKLLSPQFPQIQKALSKAIRKDFLNKMELRFIEFLNNEVIPEILTNHNGLMINSFFKTNSTNIIFKTAPEWEDDIKNLQHFFSNNTHPESVAPQLSNETIKSIISIAFSLLSKMIPGSSCPIDISPASPNFGMFYLEMNKILESKETKIHEKLAKILEKIEEIAKKMSLLPELIIKETAFDLATAKKYIKPLSKVLAGANNIEIQSLNLGRTAEKSLQTFIKNHPEIVDDEGRMIPIERNIKLISQSKLPKKEVIIATLQNNFITLPEEIQEKGTPKRIPPSLQKKVSNLFIAQYDKDQLTKEDAVVAKLLLNGIPVFLKLTVKNISEKNMIGLYHELQNPNSLKNLIPFLQSILTILLTQESTKIKAGTDLLTQIPNRAKLTQELITLLDDRRCQSHPISVIFFDIDHFKKFNDKHGHKAGDLVLQEFARRITEKKREKDWFGRWGGEEFVAILPKTSSNNIITVAKKYREAIHDMIVPYKNKKLKVTASMGGASTEQISSLNLEELIASADKALYHAKIKRDDIQIFNPTQDYENQKEDGSKE